MLMLNPLIYEIYCKQHSNHNIIKYNNNNAIYENIYINNNILQVYMHKRQNPIFSFGIRHSQYEAPLIIDADV